MAQELKSLVCPFEMGLKNFSPGMMITIVGTATGNRFNVNFKLGPNPNDDVAFHTGIRIDEKAIVRNNCISGRWNNEERVTSSGMPIQRGIPFRASFIVKYDKFELAFNDRPCAEFEYRVPLFKVKYLEIKGDLEIKQVIVGTKKQ